MNFIEVSLKRQKPSSIRNVFALEDYMSVTEKYFKKKKISKPILMDLILLLLKIREWCQHVLLSHQYLSSSKHIKNHRLTVTHITFGTVEISYVEVSI